MASLFTRIVQGEIPCYKVAEDEQYLSFLDINPLVKGHALVIPKKEVDYIFDIEDPLYSGLWQFSKRVSKAVQKVILCNRNGVGVIGLEITVAYIDMILIICYFSMSFVNYITSVATVSLNVFDVCLSENID